MGPSVYACLQRAPEPLRRAARLPPDNLARCAASDLTAQAIASELVRHEGVAATEVTDQALRVHTSLVFNPLLLQMQCRCRGLHPATPNPAVRRSDIGFAAERYLHGLLP